MEANHPNLTTQKTFYVEISRARHHAELVTDDRHALRERLEATIGERVAALEAVVTKSADSPGTGAKTPHDHELGCQGSPLKERRPALEDGPALEPRGVELEW